MLLYGKHLNKYLVLCSLIAVSMVCLTSCSTRTVITNQIAELLQTGIPSFEQEDDLVMLEKAFPANIKLLEALLENDTENPKLLILLSRLYAGYMFTSFETQFEQAEFKRKKGKGSQTQVKTIKNILDRYYLRGSEYALRALEIKYKDFSSAIKKVASAEKLINSLNKDDAPALFWFGYHLSGYIHVNKNSVKTISKAYLIEKIMKKVIELDPTYFHGNAHLILFIYYASRSPIMGGHLDKSMLHLNQLGLITGEEYLLKDLYYARYFLTQKQNKKKYIKILSSLVQHTQNKKEYRLYNKVASMRARIYLDHQDMLFEE